MLAAAAASAARVVADLGLGSGATVVEFDSHHGGSWLRHLLAAGMIPADPGRQADLVVDVHGIAHEEELDHALAERVTRLAPDGHLVMVFHHLLPLVQETQFDTIRHGHPLYLSLLALVPALARLGLHPVDVHPEKAYGGSLIVAAARARHPAGSVTDLLAEERAAGLADPATLLTFDTRAREAAQALHRWLETAVAESRTVLGYGAPSKAAVLLALSGVSADLLAFTADLSPDKQGRRIPGSGIPIRSPAELVASAPDEILVLTWDIVDEVYSQLVASGLKDPQLVLPGPFPHRYRGTGS